MTVLGGGAGGDDNREEVDTAVRAMLQMYRDGVSSAPFNWYVPSVGSLRSDNGEVQAYSALK